MRPAHSTAAATSPTSITLKWKDNASSATGYDILCASDGVDFTQIAKVTGGSATSCTDNAALADSANQYEIVAYNAALSSAPSAQAATVTPPVAPAAPTAAAVSPTSVNLAWTDKDANATSYTILRSTDGKTYASVGTVTSGSANTFTDGTVKAATTYYYEVEATHGSLASGSIQRRSRSYVTGRPQRA